MENNYVKISGVVEEPMQISYENRGEKFYEGFIRVNRNSGATDIIPVTIPEKLAPNGIAQCFITVEGEFRSFNKIVNEKSKLMLTLFAKSIVENRSEKHENIIKLHGFICKQPVYRETPLGKQICDILFAVNRRNHKSDYLPIITWGSLAETARDLTVGTELEIEGRVQSREYQKNGETKIAYEISANFVQPPELEFEPLEEIDL